MEGELSGLSCLKLELLAAGGDVVCCVLHLTAFFWDVKQIPFGHNQDPGTEGETSSGFACQV